MFIQKYLLTKSIKGNDHFSIEYIKEKNPKRIYQLDKNDLSENIFYKLHEKQDFFLIYETSKDIKPLGISFDGEIFYPINILLNHKQESLINIVNNEYQFSFFSFIHLSTIYSKDVKAQLYFCITWILSLYTSLSINHTDFDIITLISSVVLSLLSLSLFSKIRLLYSKYYVKNNKIKFKKKKIISVIPLIYEDDIIDIKDILFNNEKPDNEEIDTINRFVLDKLKDRPTDLLITQHDIFDKSKTKKQIYETIKML